MEIVDGVTPELARIFAAKEQRRHELANLSFPEKVQALIQLQNIAVPILRSRGKSVHPWRVSTLATETSSLS